MKGFKITKAHEVIDDLFRYRNNYHEKGKYLGFEGMDEYYSMSLGNCTRTLLIGCLITSNPASSSVIILAPFPVSELQFGSQATESISIYNIFYFFRIKLS